MGSRVVWVAVIAAIGTALVYGIPPILFAYPFPGAATFVAALSSASACALSVMFAMRHRRSRHRTDLYVAVLFGVVSLLEALLPMIGELAPTTDNVAFWSRVIGRTIVAIGLCVAAWLPDRRTRPVSARRIAGAVVAVAATIVAWTLLFVSTLPAAVSGTDAGNAIVRNPVVLGSRFGGTLLLLAAAVGFVRMARRLGDPVFDWLASGAVLMATARFHDFLFPSLHDDWVTTGDMLRVIAQWVVLAGLLYEVAELWRRRGADAARDERRARRGGDPRRPGPGARLHPHAEQPRGERRHQRRAVGQAASGGRPRARRGAPRHLGLRARR